MKRRTKRTACLALVYYMLLNGLAAGMLQVYVRSYNQTNREPIPAVQITRQPSAYQVQVAQAQLELIVPEQGAHQREVLLPPAVRYAAWGYDWLEQAMLRLADGKTVGLHSHSILPGR